MRLEITTHIGCPINCTDCPQALLRERYDGRLDLDFEDYKKVIDKLPDGRIDFSGMCEPFANPKCTDMILYAAEKHPIALYTTLQGSTMEDYERLKGVKFDIVVLHIPDKDGRSHFQVTDEYLELLKAWDCHSYSCHGAIDDRVLPVLKHRPIITYIHDRAGNVKDRPHKTVPNRHIYCATSIKAMNHNVLLPDGTVLMCCMDYGMTGVFGNLFTQSYEEVLNSPTAKAMRETLNEGESICRHCTNAISAL